MAGGTRLQPHGASRHRTCVGLTSVRVCHVSVCYRTDSRRQHVDERTLSFFNQNRIGLGNADFPAARSEIHNGDQHVSRTVSEWLMQVNGINPVAI